MLTLLCEFDKFDYFKRGKVRTPLPPIRTCVCIIRRKFISTIYITQHSPPARIHQGNIIQFTYLLPWLLSHSMQVTKYIPRRFLVLKKKKTFHLDPSPFIRKIQRSGYIKKVCISHTLSTIINVLISKYYMKQWVQVLVPELTYGIQKKQALHLICELSYRF